MNRIGLVVSCAALALAASTLKTARAERWVRASQLDSSVWYGADNVRPTAGGLIGVWVSTGLNRTNLGADGVTSCPAYSIIDCRQRTAGSKLSLDMGTALAAHAPNSGMGELIEKLCS